MPNCESQDKRIAALEAEVARLRSKLRRCAPTVRALLANRGLVVQRAAHSTRNLFLPPDLRYLGPFLKLFGRYSFRLFLRDVIRHGNRIPFENTTKFITAEVYSFFLGNLIRWDLLRAEGRHLRLNVGVQSLGPTLEWWLAHLVEGRLGFPCLRQVFFRGLPAGGDYDLILSVEGRLGYVEVKSSPPKQIQQKEIDSFLARVQALRPSASFFFVDTELRMYDKIVPMFETALSRLSDRPSNLIRLNAELFHQTHDLYVINAKGGVEKNLRYVVQDHLRHRPDHH